VSEVNRQRGGLNYRQGNRFEDGFAVYRCIELAPCVIFDRVAVRLREQAGCPVDDLLIHQAQRKHYHQLKDDQTITWGEDKGKLRNEFVAQKEQCDARAEDYTLTLVVSHDHRKQSLDQNLPEELRGVVLILHFPPVRRPSELARRGELREALGRISASRTPGGEVLRGIVEGFYLAWVERAIDESGSADLAQMVAWLRERPVLRIVRPLPEQIHPEWDRFVAILGGIPDLQWHHDRGYFEWFRPPRDAGFVAPPCDSEGFRRFVERVLQARPTTFEVFEGLLP
jgi:hypothetical protein